MESRILILGNGFDLAHNLPTKYTDFLHYLNEQYKNKLTNNVWMDYFRFLYNDKRRLLNGLNWIDFELEISHILKQFDEYDSNIYNPIATLSELDKDEKMKIFYNMYAHRCKCTIESVSKQTYDKLIRNMYEDMVYMINTFATYLLNKVENAEIYCFSPDIRQINANRIITFNYTHTYERLYLNNTAKIQHIHGEVCKNPDDTNNMVLGIDEYWDEDIAHRHTNYNIFKKFTQRILKETGFEYRNWIENESKKVYAEQVVPINYATDVYIFGHSLDVTDKDILQEFFSEKCFNVHIYYKDKEHEASLIANVVKMLGENEFIRQINTVPPKIEFIQQRDMACANNSEAQ